MESYEIEFQPSVRKDFLKLSPDNASRILPRIEELATDPFPPQSIKLKGSDRLYRIRVGDYRIVYEVDVDTFRILIYHVRHRREVYRDL
ncbi:type II toxin-antitoxin system RelE/ParE family toxin [Chamaesiphon sp. OTE_75_metabat_556]|uniref:type II toxin-antitoxin system RelE family toxin n=1 Tax=Chamaesiphon sp. OTE_75_metabat_556 TaxID=2964692 RepID=UPI00286AC70C|nr:type II toxin-antitoxin system RelE/ParE family toxin [Chamaesiphon sp. OTE_75_metabat_556]